MTICDLATLEEGTAHKYIKGTGLYWSVWANEKSQLKITPASFDSAVSSVIAPSWQLIPVWSLGKSVFYDALCALNVYLSLSKSQQQYPFQKRAQKETNTISTTGWFIKHNRSFLSIRHCSPCTGQLYTSAVSAPLGRLINCWCTTTADTTPQL